MKSKFRRAIFIPVINERIPTERYALLTTRMNKSWNWFIIHNRPIGEDMFNNDVIALIKVPIEAIDFVR